MSFDLSNLTDVIGGKVGEASDALSLILRIVAAIGLRLVTFPNSLGVIDIEPMKEEMLFNNVRFYFSFLDFVLEDNGVFKGE